MADHTRRTVIVINQHVPRHESWWDVRLVEFSELDTVRQARKDWEAVHKKERYYR